MLAKFNLEVEDNTKYTVKAINNCCINLKLKDSVAYVRKGKKNLGLL